MFATLTIRLCLLRWRTAPPDFSANDTASLGELIPLFFSSQQRRLCAPGIRSAQPWRRISSHRLRRVVEIARNVLRGALDTRRALLLARGSELLPQLTANATTENILHSAASAETAPEAIRKALRDGQAGRGIDPERQSIAFVA